jgi:hypothetical protein
MACEMGVQVIHSTPKSIILQDVSSSKMPLLVAVLLSV